MSQRQQTFPITDVDAFRKAPDQLRSEVSMFNPPRGNTIPRDATPLNTQVFPAAPNPTIKTEE